MSEVSRPAEADQSKLHRMLERILVALARILIRHNVGYPTFSEIAKKAFVEVATNEYGLRARPASKSRVSLLTGINRRDVARVQESSSLPQGNVVYNPVFRLVSVWIRDDRYRGGDGEPLVLPIRGDAPSLEALRRECCHDVSESAVLRELISLGIAKLEGSESIQLLTPGYIPRNDALSKLELMGIDVAVLLNTIDGNIAGDVEPLFQRKVSFHDVSERGVALLNAVAGRDAQQLLENLDQTLGAHRDQQDGQFAGLGIYVFADGRPSADQMKQAAELLSEGG